MMFALVFMGTAVLLLGCLLFLDRKQIRELTCQLQELSPKSNQRLTCFLRSRAFLSLCREMNQCLDARQQSVMDSANAQKELQYTIACVSHDIRTPLTGAAGYTQMLERTKEEEKRREYCRIIRQKLGDLEQLLDELFLYTRLAAGEIALECKMVQLFPILCDAAAGFYQQFEETGREPDISFSEETVKVWAEPGQLRRVLRNLISNGLSHGVGTMMIRQEQNQLVFSNRVKNPEEVHPQELFSRFFRAEKSRTGTHAGLGLSIAKELMERMGGKIEAELLEDMLEIRLTFKTK